MVVFCDGETTVFSYINENGGSSRIKMDNFLVDKLPSITGLSMNDYIQMQFDDIKRGHKRFDKYFRSIGCTFENTTRRKLGDIIRLVALDDFANSIPDCDL